MVFRRRKLNPQWKLKGDRMKRIISCPKCNTEKEIESDFTKDNRRVYRCHSCQTKFLSNGKIVTDVDKNIVVCSECGATFDITVGTPFRVKGRCFCGAIVAQKDKRHNPIGNIGR